MDIDQSLEVLTQFKNVPEFGALVICRAKLTSPIPFDPSINGHDFFSRTITCSCVGNSNCNKGLNTVYDEKNIRPYEVDGCRRTRKNEYARQQMKKYREKIKQDPVRYMKYLQGERERNARRKIKKIQKLMTENSNMNGVEFLKLQRRKENLMNRARVKFEKDIMNVNIQDDAPEPIESLTPPEDYINKLMFKMEQKNRAEKTYVNKKKILAEQPNLQIKEISNKICDNNQIFKPTTTTTTYEIGSGNGPFTNLKIVKNEPDDESWKLTKIKMENDDENLENQENRENQENEIEVKQEMLSDNSNSNSQESIQIDCDFSQYNSFTSDSEAPDDYQNDFKFNRVCAIVNCPSRFSNKEEIKYYPFPPQQHIRDCWLNLIKTKTKQWIIDTETFVCSIHFATAWFQVDSNNGDKMLMLNAVPTIFPNETAAQFDIEIPEIKVEQFKDPLKFQNYYSWSTMKLREQENLLKEQQVIIENQSELKIIQSKRMENLCKTIEELNSNLKYSNDKHLTDLFETLNVIKNDFIS